MKLGILLPLGDIGGDPATVGDFAQAAEEMGYDDLAAPDHVLGVNAASRPDWGARNTSKDLFHDPFVLFGYLAGRTKGIGFSTQVLILPQRQAVLVAKQAACLDVLCGGRFRLGVGVGWNPVEFEGLNENFHHRGARSAEQVHVMQLLWAAPHVTFKGRWHTIEDAGINPRPASGRVPVWFGGDHDATLRRTARYGDGWMPNAYRPGDDAKRAFETLRAYAEQEGRAPDGVGLECWVSMGEGSEADWRREAAAWKQMGVSRLCLSTTFNRRGHSRIPGRSVSDHLAAMRRYREAVADVLQP
jgi:probable F420-dependent oxidoreductase